MGNAAAPAPAPLVGVSGDVRPASLCLSRPPQERHDWDNDLRLSLMVVGAQASGRLAFARCLASQKFMKDMSAERKLQETAHGGWNKRVVDFADHDAPRENGDRVRTLNISASIIQVRDSDEENFYNAPGVFLAFDLTDHASFDSLLGVWVPRCEERIRPPPQYILVGLKADLPNRRVRFEEAAHLATVLGVPYVECSSADGAQVDDALATLLHRVINVNRTKLPEWIEESRMAWNKCKPHFNSAACTMT